MRALIALSIALIAAACGAPSPQQTAQDSLHAAGVLAIEDAWAAPTPAGVDVSAGYLTIVNATAADDRLLRATSPRAARVEIHEMTMDGAVMRMRPVEVLTAPADEEISLAPGGMHLMFFGLAEPFAEGQDIPMQLTFETAGTIDVTLPVRRSAPENHAAH